MSQGDRTLFSYVIWPGFISSIFYLSVFLLLAAGLPGALYHIVSDDPAVTDLFSLLLPLALLLFVACSFNPGARELKQTISDVLKDKL